MKDIENEILPEVTIGESRVEEQAEENEVIGDSVCPCCGYLTIPNQGDALGYICPVCFWEIDLFITTENEPSDSNNGMSVLQARKNYEQFGAVKDDLVCYCRLPKKEECVK